MVDINIDHQYGDALINASTCFPDMELLQSEFDIFEFLDWCTGLDAVVLHTNLHTAGSLTTPEKSPMTEALLQENILKYHTVEAEDRSLYAKSIVKGERTQSIFKSVPKIIPENNQHTFLKMHARAAIMCLDIELEERLQIPLVVPSSWSQLYLLLPDVKTEQTAFNEMRDSLSKRYSDLSEILISMRGAYDDDIVSIPPIALEILSRASSLSEVPKITLDMRDKYSKIRTLCDWTIAVQTTYWEKACPWSWAISFI